MTPLYDIDDTPSGWDTVQFVDAVSDDKYAKPTSILRSDFQSFGQYPIIDQGQDYIAGYTDDDSRVIQSPLPIIVFGDHTRHFKYVDFPFAVGADGTKLIAPRHDRFHPMFLYFQFLSMDIPSKGYNRHFKVLREKQIVAPPIPEQRKIAAVLSAIQEAKEKTENVISALTEMKKSMMKHLFTYGAVPIEDVGKVKLRETEVGEAPEHWRHDLCGSFITLQRGYDLPQQKRKSGTVPIVSSSGITGYHSEAKVQCPGVVTGRYGTLGDTFYVESDFWPLNTTLFIKDFHRNDPMFVHYFLQTLNLASLNDKTSVPGVNRNHVHALRVAIPAIQEQQTIASTLSAMDRKINAEKSKYHSLQEMFKTLLSHLMSGKLRVNHLEI